MSELPLDPPKQSPRSQAIAVTSDQNDKTTQRYRHRDILAMYPSLRLDHLRYLEKCGLLKPVHVAGNERFFGFTDLTALRQLAGELQQGTPFRAVVRTLQSSRAGQLTFDFRLDAHPARILELKPRAPQPFGTDASGTQGRHPPRHPRHLKHHRHGRVRCD